MADNDHETIKGWTKAEKINLIEALKSHGLNMKLIAEKIPTKTPEELKSGLDQYKRIALQHPIFTLLAEKEKEKEKEKGKKQKRKSLKKKANGPILKWQQELIKASSPDELRTETSTAVRIIADCEDIPPPAATSNIDMRQVYHQIANAMEGKPIEADAGTAAVLMKCVVETALRSKLHMNPNIKDFLSKVRLSDREEPVAGPVGSAANPELAIIRHLNTQRNYNPLNVPEELLKASFGPDKVGLNMST